MGSGAEASFRKVDHRSPGTALLSVALETGATESSSVRQRMHAAAASNWFDGSWLLHFVDGAGGHRTARLRAAGRRFTGVSVCRPARRRCGRDRDVEDHRRGAGVGLRLVVTSAVRLTPCSRPSSGPASRMRSRAAREQSESGFGELRAASVIDDGVQTVVGLGHRWRAAMDSIAWDQGTCSSWAPTRPTCSPGFSWAPTRRRSCGTLRSPSWCCQPDPDAGARRVRARGRPIDMFMTLLALGSPSTRSSPSTSSRRVCRALRRHRPQPRRRADRRRRRPLTTMGRPIRDRSPRGEASLAGLFAGQRRSCRQR